jgi:hypothetical protein
MDLYGKPVRTRHDTADRLIDSDPTYVYWIHLTPTTSGTLGNAIIRNGRGADGSIAWEVSTEHGRAFSFYPPIRCDQGVYVDIDSNISDYTIGYLPASVLESKGE